MLTRTVHSCARAASVLARRGPVGLGLVGPVVGALLDAARSVIHACLQCVHSCARAASVLGTWDELRRRINILSIPSFLSSLIINISINSNASRIPAVTFYCVGRLCFIVLDGYYLLPFLCSRIHIRKRHSSPRVSRTSILAHTPPLQHRRGRTDEPPGRHP